jgi:hemerythrin-like domain-containing protein
MNVRAGDIRELMGEHEGIRAHMRFLAKSQNNLSVQDIQAKQKIWAYRCGLHDFKDEIQFHIEIDERIFHALPEGVSIQSPVEEHREILKLINELINLADNAIIDRLSFEELGEYTVKISLAVDKIFHLVEIHLKTENEILEKALSKIQAGKC